MRPTSFIIASVSLISALGIPTVPAGAQDAAPPPRARPDTTPDPLKDMVGRLSLENYKATIKGLTQFGDRRQGTDRNRQAVDWIEAQLKSYGCTNTERIKYDYSPAPQRGGGGGRAAAGTGGRAGADSAGRAGAARGTAGRGAAAGAGRGAAQAAAGGGRYRGMRTRTGVNNDSLRQPDVTLRTLNTQPSTPGAREQVFCTKVGTTHADEMYIVGGHMDGIGWGEAANDDGSGTALVMELARVFSSPDVETERSIRFILWNNEETGTNGARAYIEQRLALQGIENPAGSGRFPEPRWLGMITHDMMLFDHGAPRADSTMSPEQRPEADVNIEFAMTSRMSEGAQKLAWAFHAANEKYATDYPAQVGPHMSNTDSGPFQDIVASISLREAERGTQVGAGWDPQWHQPTDLYATYSDKDFRLGLNAAQTSFGALGQLTGAKLKVKQ